MGNNLSNKLGEAISLSRKSRLLRFLEKPFFTIRTSLLLHYYHLCKENKPFYIWWKTFWGGRAYLNITSGGGFFPWGFINDEPEIKLTRFLVEHLNSGDIFFDVGAHYGFYSMLASELVGETGQVHVFEPTPCTYKALSKNLNNKKNVVLNRKAAWSNNGKILFTDFGENFSAQNTFMKETILPEVNLSKGKKRIEVTTIRLDSYVASFSTHFSPNFIKIDVEGAESFVVDGMPEILHSDVKPIISIEFWGKDNWANKNEAVLNTLKGYGYSVFFLDQKSLRPYNGEKDFNYENLIFMK